jgi:hypothetical protein
MRPGGQRRREAQGALASGLPFVQNRPPCIRSCQSLPISVSATKGGGALTQLHSGWHTIHKVHAVFMLQCRQRLSGKVRIPTKSVSPHRPRQSRRRLAVFPDARDSCELSPGVEGREDDGKCGIVAIMRRSSASRQPLRLSRRSGCLGKIGCLCQPNLSRETISVRSPFCLCTLRKMSRGHM